MVSLKYLNKQQSTQNCEKYKTYSRDKNLVYERYESCQDLTEMTDQSTSKLRVS